MADNQDALAAASMRGEKAKAMYSRLESLRWVTLERARDCSALTLPALMPSQWINDQTEIPEPFQSVGAKGVNNLASRLLLTLFPPGQPWFRLKIRDAVKAQFKGDRLSQIEDQLSEIEQVINDKIEISHARALMAELLKHLIVGGTALLHVPDRDAMRFFRLDQHCIVRDAMDRPLRVVVKESTVAAAIPDDIAAVCRVSKKDEVYKVDIYTMICWDWAENKVHFWQEINDVEVPKSRSKQPIDRCEWIPLRWISVPGRDYGRGHVEEYLGDLRSLEALSTAMVQFAAAAAKIVMLVHPNATTSVTALNRAESGDSIVGSKADVDVLQLEKMQDFSVVQSVSQRLEQRLSQAFLIPGEARQAERVTAEEIRQQAQELENALGGVYTVLAQELQLPLAQRLLIAAQRAKEIPVLPEGVANPVVVTGFEALGRNHELNRLMGALQALGQLFPQVAEQQLDFQEVASRIMTAYGVTDAKSLWKPPQQVAQEQQQQTMQQSMIRAAPQAAGPAMKHFLGQSQGTSQ